MRIILLILVIFCFNLGVSQVDTLALKKQVDEIETGKNHVDFWDFIFERDQNMFSTKRTPHFNFLKLNMRVLTRFLSMGI